MSLHQVSEERLEIHTAVLGPYVCLTLQGIPDRHAEQMQSSKQFVIDV